jgi:hypothetical protein
MLTPQQEKSCKEFEDQKMQRFRSLKAARIREHPLIIFAFLSAVLPI